MATSPKSDTKKTTAKTVASKPKTATKTPVAKAAAKTEKPAAPAAKKTATTPAKKTSAPKATKPAATAKSPAKKNTVKKTVSPEDRYHMIQTAAYFRAEQRGFAGGYEMEDWIAGEAQIDAMINA